MESRRRLKNLVEAFRSLQTKRIESRNSDQNLVATESLEEHPDQMKLLTSGEKPFYISAPLLLHRSYLHQIRQPAVSTTRLSQGWFYALILCAYFAPIGNDQSSIQNRIGILYELTALCFIGMLSAIAIYPTERNVFYREYTDGFYSAVTFIFSYFSLAMPTLLLTAVGIAVLVTYSIGLQPKPLAIGQFAYVCFCFIFNGECLAIIFCSIFDQIGFSVNVVSPVISFLCKTLILFTYF